MEDFRTSYIVLEYSRNLVSVTIMSITCLQTRWLTLSKANPNSNSTRVEVRHSSHLEPTPPHTTPLPQTFRPLLDKLGNSKYRKLEKMLSD